jgi:putative polyhydroxyalkanoate system protein
MAHIDITRRHTLGRSGARQAAEAVADELRAHYRARTTWEGDTLSVDGPGVTGALTATEDTVRITASLGLALRPLRRTLEAEIQRRLDESVG